ncbi:MAG: 16S rRNA (cytosine(967)-C(5))-methyltransferase RsmB [Clostridia bacterium]|nr:16S rRNA (cytosine(967)-C(5))-methyltransferase RsmB [Clostridia bacterium]
MTNPRKLAVSALLKIEKDNAYSNITLAAFLKEAEFSPQDKALFSALVYGVLDRKITLDYVLSKYMKTPLKKTAPFTLAVLRTALFQIMFMDKIPESAAVNEAVKIIKKSKESRNAGFVNAVLRGVLREGFSLPEGDTAGNLSIKYSCPLWICESFCRDYGIDTAKKILEESLKTPPLSIRVNNIKTDAESLKQEFLNAKIDFEKGGNDNCLVIKGGMDISQNDLYKKGLFYAQDEASQRAVGVLSPKKGERVLDMCAAPGGKSFTMAGLMQNEGEIIACDLYEKRAGLIAEGAKRLGLSIIKTAVADATVFDKSLGEFDGILCDVPCSGLGVLRRKPDIKYKPECDFRELEEIQYSILCNARKYLKKGGRILYSTCTLRQEENENLVIRFQKEYNTFRKVYEHTFMPHIDGTDGFYCALLESKE